MLFSQQHSLIASDKARKEIGVVLIMLIEIKQKNIYNEIHTAKTKKYFRKYSSRGLEDIVNDH